MNETDPISPEGQRKLLAIARAAVTAAVRGQPAPEPRADEPELQARCGAFVTLTTGGRLRGCLGCFTSDEPIAELVHRMARSSATEDPRFFGEPLRPQELDRVHIEISVLSPMRRVDDPLREVKLGVHGIYIKSGWNSGTFLPQVATEHHMDLEEFLSTCCSHKAGLPGDAWRAPQTEVYVYTAQVFHEE
jgi:AmmeMemoRadiSam system protein A